MKIFQIVLIAIFLGCNSQQNSNDLLITAANTLNVNAENYKLNSLNTLSDFEGLIDPYSFQPVDCKLSACSKSPSPGRTTGFNYQGGNINDQ
jgi:hypothetical protein